MPQAIPTERHTDAPRTHMPQAIRTDAPRTATPHAITTERRTEVPGTAVLTATREHRVRIHAGPPSRGRCRHHNFVYTRGEVDVFPAGSADEWRQADPSTSLLLSLSPALFRRAAEELGRDPDRVAVDPMHQFRDPQIEHIAWALDAERSAGAPGGSIYAESLGLALAVRLLDRARPLAAPPPAPRGLSPAQLRRITDHIEAHLDGDLSLATLADLAGLGASHMKTLFRRSLGVPVHAYVIQRRVERARTLLLRGDLPASRIALESGFSHQSHMARCMRRLLGLTPTALARPAR